MKQSVSRQEAQCCALKSLFSDINFVLEYRHDPVATYFVVLKVIIQFLLVSGGLLAGRAYVSFNPFPLPSQTKLPRSAATRLHLVWRHLNREAPDR
jgi:hypothetical protein